MDGWMDGWFHRAEESYMQMNQGRTEGTLFRDYWLCILDQARYRF
jgi:hypothetical protein